VSYSINQHKMRLINLIGCLILIFLVSCAPAVITSDHIMFPSKNQYPEKIKYLGFSSMISVELPSYQDALIKQYRLKNHDGSDKDKYFESLISAGMLNLSFLKLNFANSKNTVGMSVQPFFLGPSSIDATVKLKDSYYLSGGVFNNGLSGLLQKRLNWDGTKGSSIGIYGYYRQHLNIYFSESEYVGMGHSFGESSFIGIRYKYFKAGKQPQNIIENKDESFIITAGYNIEFKSIGLRLGYAF